MFSVRACTRVYSSTFQDLDFDVSLSPLYQLMLQSWYRKTAQSLVNMLVLFRHGEIFSYYGILMSRMKCNFWQSLNKFCTWGSELNLNFRKFKVALDPMHRIALNVSLNLSIYYSFRHVLKPATPEHHNTPEYPG